MELENSRTIVTGASQGVGLAIAEALIARGGRVAGLARTARPLQEAADRLGGEFVPIVCDVRDLEAVRRAVVQVKEALGGIDALVNNAGVGRFGAIDELSKDDWDEMIATNVSGVYHCTREVTPDLKEQGHGHIVNIASIAGLIGNPNLFGYNASKYAVRGMTDALFKELREFGIKVSAVYPGSIETGFSGGRRPSSASHKMRPGEVAEVVIHILERSDNFLISEVVLRPLRPRG